MAFRMFFHIKYEKVFLFCFFSPLKKKKEKKKNSGTVFVLFLP